MTSPEAQYETQAREQPEATQQQPQTFQQPETTLQQPETARETQRREEETRGQQKTAMGNVVHLHTAHPRVPIPYVTPGDMFRTGRAAASMLPSPRRVAFYGLLGGMTVLGALEWPVAVAVGAATEVITREQRAERARTEREQRQAPGETVARAEPAQQPEAAAR